MQAASINITHCSNCKMTVRLPVTVSSAFCPRCNQALTLRQSNSLKITSFLLAASIILLVPANIYPIMTVVNFGHEHTGTIFSGVIQLMHSGMYGIAFLVFFASLIVPIFKIVGLTLLCFAVKFRWQINHKQATTTYRFIRFIGRWSMLDLFMISILATLVKLGVIATVEAGAGATAFAFVVVLTILASHSFDQRLIWDLASDEQ